MNCLDQKAPPTPIAAHVIKLVGGLSKSSFNAPRKRLCLQRYIDLVTDGFDITYEVHSEYSGERSILPVE